MGYEENDTTKAAERGTLPPNKKTYEGVRFLGLESATRFTTRPFAYVIPPELTRVRDNLDRHGVELEILREDLTLDVESFAILGIDRADKPFQKHHLVQLTTEMSLQKKNISAGSLIVRTNQDLGRLIMLLLEPESQDGLVTWNFLDKHLELGKPYPIVRLPKPIPLRTIGYRELKPDHLLQKKRIRFDDVFRRHAFEPDRQSTFKVTLG